MERMLLLEFQNMKNDLNNADFADNKSSGFHDIINDPMLAPEFDIVSYLNKNFGDE